MRLTPQRAAVLECLVRSRTHLTADQIRAALNQRAPRASRATVYNALNALCEAGLVQMVYLEDAVARYDANIEPHHHFVCRVCGRIEDVERKAVNSLTRYDLNPGYEVEDYEVVLRGVCAPCAQKKTRSGQKRRPRSRG